jgi:hypothetical protein
MTSETSGLTGYLQKHYALRTVLYHIISLPLVIYVIKSGSFKGGPCNPGFDLAAWFGDILITAILLFVSIGGLATKGKAFRLPVFINVLVIVILMLIGAL